MEIHGNMGSRRPSMDSIADQRLRPVGFFGPAHRRTSSAR